MKGRRQGQWGAIPLSLWGTGDAAAAQAHEPGQRDDGPVGAAGYVAVVLDLGPEAEEPLSYGLPPALLGRVAPGQRVRVRVRSRRQPVVGVVWSLQDRPGVSPERVRLVEELLDPAPLLTPHELAMAAWLAEQTASTLGQALRLLLPPGGGAHPPTEGPLGYYPAAAPPNAADLLERAPRQRQAWEAVRARPGQSLAELLAGGCSAQAVAALVGRGWVERRRAARPLPPEPLHALVRPAELTAEQQAALQAIVPALQGPQHRAFLLWGVTGSGKTEVYLRAIEQVLGAGRQALVLVPQIALTPQVVALFQDRFAGSVAVLHSGLGDAERLQAWWRVRAGEAAVVVGARSAIFAPLPRLGLIVVDEEHDPSYRQEEAPRYHARDVALWRGSALGIPVILGSATPDLRTFAAAADGSLVQLELPRRVGDRPLPAIQLADRRDTGGPPPRGEDPPGALAEAATVLTPPLASAMERHLAAGGQVLLFINRRGFAPALLCARCGFVARCQSCSVSLSFHRADGQLHCHYCGARRPAPATCPRCGGTLLRLRGVGTERVEAEVAQRWPGARVLRMDRDATRRRGAHQAIYEALRRGAVDILVGTEMIAQGWDIAGVTLVGVVDADTLLHHPDYRAAERTFQLLCQVAGRAGRGEQPGEVIIQTYAPEHPAVRAARTHDYRAFAMAELAVRRETGFPPFGHLVRLLSWAPQAAEAAQGARALAAAVEAEGRPPEVTLWGPGACPLERLRGQYRWQVALRGPDGAVLRRLGRAALRRCLRQGVAAQLALDPDPSSML